MCNSLISRVASNAVDGTELREVRPQREDSLVMHTGMRLREGIRHYIHLVHVR